MFGNWLIDPVFRWNGFSLTAAGVFALVVCILIGFSLAGISQSNFTSRLFGRIGLDQKFFAIVRFVLSVFFVVGFLVLGLNLAGLTVPWEQQIPGLNLSLAQILRLIFAIFLVFWLSSVIKGQMVSRVLSKSGLDASLQYAIAQVTGYALITIGFFLALQNTGINLSALTVFAGAVGVGVGLGLQNISSNFISGLILLAERPIKIGDRVEVHSVAGRVTEIRARSTTVVTNDNITLIVPNSLFVEHTITNWSHGDQKVRFRIPVGVAYGSDLATVKEALLEVARNNPATLSDPEPRVFFESFGDSALNLELVVWSVEMSFRPRRFRSDLNFAIHQAFRERGIELPFPQRDIHVRSGGLVLRRSGSETRDDDDQQSTSAREACTSPGQTAHQRKERSG
jgi:small-conductance mechanosensitive channel